MALCQFVLILLTFQCFAHTSLQSPLDGAPQAPLRVHPTTADDYSWISEWAAIGDSYAAGIGSGTRLQWPCSRYNKSYPALLDSDAFFGRNPNRTFNFEACSGETSEQIRVNQISKLNNNSLDLITLSAGGNDVGLGVILNECIFQFFLSKSDDCEKALANSQSIIQSNLSQNIDLLLESLKYKLKDGHGRIYYTGYAKFFAVDDEACNNITWAVWSQQSQESKQYLTLERRKLLNNMVDDVNSKIRSAVARAGDHVSFVEYDNYVAIHKGRFCEAGIIEPSANRLGLLFYEWDTLDSNENKTALSHTSRIVRNGSFEGDIAYQIQKTLREHPNWKFGPNKTTAVNLAKLLTQYEDEEKTESISDTIFWLLPDTWKRVFHLRPNAHQHIAQLILEQVKASRVKSISDTKG